MKKIFTVISAAALTLCLHAQDKEVKLTLLETSDIHGNYLPYDFINGNSGKGSMARISKYVNDLRHKNGKESVILLENGDILQGQPIAYYYNFIDTVSTHLCADILNYMQYDAGTVGNHDIETGHAVYDRWAAQCRFHMLGANVIDGKTGKPYWKPYTIIERQGARIAVLGMITPGIPQWLPENLWSGLRFDDLVETARRYMPQMQAQADIVVGLFHSGVGNDNRTTAYAENAAVQVAKSVPGFDIVFCGHDHRRANRIVQNTKGDSVLIMNPAANAHSIARADITLNYRNHILATKYIKGDLINVADSEPEADFIQHFATPFDTVRQFTNRVIGYNKCEMETLPAFFGPSAFVDFIHQMQLSISGADVSFVAPLAFDARIPEGEICVRDMFNLYRYENLLYVMNLTGQEIKDYLEYSYAGWTNQMKSKDDHLLLFRNAPESIAEPWQRFMNPSYNFDSAAGIIYTVDVTQPTGHKIHITQMADGTPFALTKKYRCAINSYRGNGGGGLLTKGAGIAPDKLTDRIEWSTDKDLRYYLMTAIEALGTISPTPLNQWKFIPEDWAEAGKLRDEPLLK